MALSSFTVSHSHSFQNSLHPEKKPCTHQTGTPLSSSLPPAPANLDSFCLYEIAYPRYLIKMASHICSFLFG